MSEQEDRADLADLPTERVNPRTVDLDLLDTLGILRRINAEDQTLATAVERVLPELALAVDLAEQRWQQGGRIVLFGAGTSGRLALLDAAELGPTFGVPAGRYSARMAGGNAAMQVAVEGAEDDLAAGRQAASDLESKDVAFGIAASGRTPWVRGALTEARARGAATVGLACVPLPALRQDVDVCIAVDTGPEAVTGSTRMKAGSAQKMVLNAFSTALMVRLGKVYGNRMVDVQATNEKLRVRAVGLVQDVAGVSADQARRALEAAGWEVKPAIVALRLGVDPSEARGLLDGAGGRLRHVLEPPEK